MSSLRLRLRRGHRSAVAVCRRLEPPKPSPYLTYGRYDKYDQFAAIKQLDRNGLQGNREFLVEVLMVGLLHHQNLVNLIGYCADGDQRLLVYEFMSLGSLEDHLLGLSYVNHLCKLFVENNLSPPSKYEYKAVLKDTSDMIREKCFDKMSYTKGQEEEEVSAKSRQIRSELEEEAISTNNDDDSEYSTKDDSKEKSDFDGEEENIMEEDGELSSKHNQNDPYDSAQEKKIQKEGMEASQADNSGNHGIELTFKENSLPCTPLPTNEECNGKGTSPLDQEHKEGRSNRAHISKRAVAQMMAQLSGWNVLPTIEQPSSKGSDK
ncbi:hypothetical protein Syun_019504 [Stephania yunnanensis]|uniref:Serine-threonine/tyrosine-protein kinase catalytic domain-containing protein n=1 Tax=Stephania yunnanensis TaxID=152371 RepID=A0AAP0IU76_9MAGN